MRLPPSRGPVSAGLTAFIRGTAHALPALPEPESGDAAALHDDDLQLALWTLYELHYAGFDDADDAWEWHPALLGLRHALEQRFEAALRDVTRADAEAFPAAPADFATSLFDVVGRFDGPSPARYVRNHATAGQARELLVHKSIYNLKEADPHTWAIPRLSGPAKVALVSLQHDEYGSGFPERQHAELFRDSLVASGLDPRYGAYLDAAPAVTLANNNMMSMFGLHRRLRGAAVGHLAAFEATSSLPARDCAAGLRRLGLGAAAPYFDEHVEADAVHEQIAARQICGRLIADEPGLRDDVVFGAAACLRLDALVGAHQLDHWRSGLTSLRRTAPLHAAKAG